MGSGGSKTSNSVTPVPATNSTTNKQSSSTSPKSQIKEPTPQIQTKKPASKSRTKAPFPDEDSGLGTGAQYNSPVPYEPEPLILTGDWEVEKGIDDDIPHSGDDYPRIRPWTPVSAKITFTSVDFEIMTRNNLTLAEKSFEAVAESLTERYHLDVLKVRALTTWLSCQKIRTRKYPKTAQSGTVLEYMRRIHENQGTFAGLLALLCRAIPIPCVVIKGTCKSLSHTVGEHDLHESKSTWNAVYLDSSWQIVHPFLICTPLSSATSATEWTLLESSKTEVSQKPGMVLNTFYFAPRPIDFIHCCLPDEDFSKWQLLDNIWSYQKYIDAPFLRAAFFSAGLELKSDSKCVLTADCGRCAIRIKDDSDQVNNTQVLYELYGVSGDTEQQEEGKLVLCARNETMWNIQMKFPFADTFKLALYGKVADWFFWLGDFKIVCTTPVSNYVPQPELPEGIGWGPTNFTEQEGLLAPSHEGGIIFFHPKESHVIKFIVTKRLDVRFELEHAERDSAPLQKYCVQRQRSPVRNEIDFVVQLPLNGEFALRIYKRTDDGEDVNVCNYLFTDADDSRKREDVFQRRARTNIRSATAGHEIAALENAINKFVNAKLEEDDDLLRARRRLRYLHLKRGLRDGRRRRHEKTLAQAIYDAECSTCAPALHPAIVRARTMLQSLRALETHCHPVRDMEHTTVAEIANFVKPPCDVHKTMTATYLLLGEDRKSLEKWGNIQALLRHRGKNGIQQRIAQFREDPIPNIVTIATVRRLHDSISKKTILAASLSASTFYNWVSGALEYATNFRRQSVDTVFSGSDVPLADMGVTHAEDIEEEEDEGFQDV